MYIALYTINYEDKYLSVFLRTLSTKQKYMPTILHIFKNRHK